MLSASLGWRYVQGIEPLVCPVCFCKTASGAAVSLHDVHCTLQACWQRVLFWHAAQFGRERTPMPSVLLLLRQPDLPTRHLLPLLQDGPEGEYTVHYNSYEEGGKVGKPESVKVDAIIGADGANSRVAKEIDAGEYDYAIAFQVGAAPVLGTRLVKWNPVSPLPRCEDSAMTSASANVNTGKVSFP